MPLPLGTIVIKIKTVRGDRLLGGCLFFQGVICRLSKCGVLQSRDDGIANNSRGRNQSQISGIITPGGAFPAGVSFEACDPDSARRLRYRSKEGLLLRGAENREEQKEKDSVSPASLRPFLKRRLYCFGAYSAIIFSRICAGESFCSFCSL